MVAKIKTIKTLREGKIDLGYVSFEQGIELAVRKTCDLLKKLNRYLSDEDGKRLPTIGDLQYLHKRIQTLKEITGREKICNTLLGYLEKAAEELSACYTEKKDPYALWAYVATINEGLLKMGSGEDFRGWEADSMVMKEHGKAKKSSKIRKTMLEKQKEGMPSYIR